MKTLFVVLLIVSTSVFIPHNEIPITLFGIGFSLPSIIGVNLKIVLIPLIILFVYWVIEEIKANNIFHTSLLLFRSKFRRYLEAKKGNKIEDLKKIYPEIGTHKDLYYIKKTLILKTTDITEDGKYKPCGYVLKVSKPKLYWLCFINGFKTILNLKFFPYAGLLLWSLIIVVGLLLQFVSTAKELL